MRELRSVFPGLSGALVVLVLAGPSCGGGGGGGNGPTSVTGPPPTTTPAPTPTPAASGSPVLHFTANPATGIAPLHVDLDLCDSRDGANGQSLLYFADFDDSKGSQQLANCKTSHTFSADGVKVYNIQLCVKNADGSGTPDCGPQRIVAFLRVKEHVDQSQAVTCASKVSATAELLQGSSFGDVGAASTVDDVLFKAYNDATVEVDHKHGIKSGATWSTGTWNVNSTKKLRITATEFANGIEGDTDDGTRPNCGS